MDKMYRIEIFTDANNFTLEENDDFVKFLMGNWNNYSPKNKTSHISFQFSDGWKAINLSMIMAIHIKEIK